MPLDSGDINASKGMSKAIYGKLEELLSPSLSGMNSADLDKVKNGWKLLAYAIAKGVVDYIKSESEVKGVEIKINENTVYTQTNTVRVA